MQPLLQRPIWRELKATLHLAFPIIAGQLLQNSLGVIDTLMVGQVSVDGVAACSFAISLFVVPLIFGFGVLGAISVLIARAHGRGDGLESLAVLKRGLWLSLGLAVLIAGLISVLAFHLAWFNQPAVVAEQARGFLLIIIWSIVPVYLMQTLKQYAEALHRPWPPLVILVLGAGANVFLNWIFIYGHFGAPALGLLGAGWATLASRTLMLLMLAIYVVVKLLPKEVQPVPHQPAERPYRELLALGLPVGLQVGMEVTFFSSAAIMMGWISKEALAAHQVAMSVASTTFMVPLGLAMAVSIRVSHAFGANKPESVRAIAQGTLFLAALFMMTMAIVIFFLARPLANAFVHDEAVIQIATRLLVIAAIFQIFDGVQMICMGVLRGMQDVKIPTMITLCGYWVLCLPLAYILAFVCQWGAVGVWISFPAALGFTAVLLLWRMERHLPRRAI